MLSLSSDFELKNFAILVEKYGFNFQNCVLLVKKNNQSDFSVK